MYENHQIREDMKGFLDQQLDKQILLYSLNSFNLQPKVWPTIVSFNIIDKNDRFSINFKE
jgi:hypothetical protein